MVVYGHVIDDETILRITLSAVREGLRRVEEPIERADEVEREMELYYQFRDELMRAVHGGYDRISKQVALRVMCDREASEGVAEAVLADTDQAQQHPAGAPAALHAPAAPAVPVDS